MDKKMEWNAVAKKGNNRLKQRIRRKKRRL